MCILPPVLTESSVLEGYPGCLPSNSTCSRLCCWRISHFPRRQRRLRTNGTHTRLDPERFQAPIYYVVYLLQHNSTVCVGCHSLSAFLVDHYFLLVSFRAWPPTIKEQPTDVLLILDFSIENSKEEIKMNERDMENDLTTTWISRSFVISSKTRERINFFCTVSQWFGVTCTRKFINYPY